MNTDLLLILIALIQLVLIVVLLLRKPDEHLSALLSDKLHANELNESERYARLREELLDGRQKTAETLSEPLRVQNDRLASVQIQLQKEFAQVNTQINRSNEEQFDKLRQTIEQRLMLIDRKVNENLNAGFEKTNVTFQNVLERLSRIDEAQKKIDALSGEIVSLQDVLNDKKTRGTFGEVQLYQLLSNVFGERNDRIYRMQVSLSNGTRADAVLYTPQPLGTLAIDSKFPLENYRRMIDTTLEPTQRNIAEKQFVADFRKHIDAIADKYIIPGETADQAFMFLPAEAVFAQVHAYHPELIDYAAKRHVWIASPTTLMSTLTTIQTILINIERSKYTRIIQKQLGLLNEEFNRYRKRWDALSAHMDTVSKDVREIHTTTEKITRKFEAIVNVEDQRLDNEDEH